MLEQRKAKRFPIRVPVRILRRGSRPALDQGETRNLSSRGVLFVSNARLSVGERIEYVITLPSEGRSEKAVDLFCLGKVVRAERLSSAENAPLTYSIAATLERYEFVRPGRISS